MNTNQPIRAVVAVSLVSSASAHLNAAAIAYWKFEPQNLTADSFRQHIVRMELLRLKPSRAGNGE
jgi:hypothetical protein